MLIPLSPLLHQGPYSIKFSAQDDAGTSLFCVEMAFTITPPHKTTLLGAEGAGVLRPAGGILAGAVKRDAMEELRSAFRQANGEKAQATADVSAVPL